MSEPTPVVPDAATVGPSADGPGVPSAGPDGAAAPPDPASEPAEQREFDQAAENWRRLSARMLLVHPLQELKRFLIPLLVLVFVGRGGRPEIWPLIGLGVAIVLGVSRWVTTTYRVMPSQVQVRRGLVQRSTITVPRDRVRTVDITSHLLHRVLGLARITVGTGQTDRKKEELRLDALTLDAAHLLRTELLHERPAPSSGTVAPGPRQAADEPAPPPSRVLATLNPAWVRYAPFTLSGLVTIGVFAAFMANLINQTRVDVTNSSIYATTRRDLSAMSWISATLVIIVVFVLVVAVLSAGGYIMQFWGFRLSREGATLHITRGLLTTRQTTIEERRLRGVEISEPLLLRWARGARCLAITTGLRVGRGAERGGSVLLPAAPAAEVDRVAVEVLATAAPVRVDLVKHGPRARRRRFTRALVGAAVLSGIVATLWPSDWIWFSFVAAIFVGFGLYLAFDRYRNLGHALVDGYLVARQGSAIRRRYMLECDGIIGWNERQSFFQRRAGVATLKATTAAGRGGYEIIDVEPAVGIALADAATPGLLTEFLTA